MTERAAGVRFGVREDRRELGQWLSLKTVGSVMQVELLAHSLNQAGNRQTLAEHLKNVATLAATFSSPFGEEDAARFVALVHDMGKAKGTWQERLIQLEAG